MKKIMCPTDFSSNADHALKYTVNLCRMLEADLIVFHSCKVDAFAYQLLNQEVDEEVIVKNAKEKLHNYIKNLKLGNENFKILELVDFGLAVDSIVDVAAEEGIDLIVMGTHGASGLEEVMLGSHTTNVVERATCPVLAIPDKADFKNPGRICFATDYREKDIEALKYLSEVAEVFSSEIRIVHVAELLVPNSLEKALARVFEEEIAANIAYKNISFEIIKGAGTTKALNKYVEENDMDWIALSMHKRSVFEKLFNPSVTKKMAYHSKIPLLAFHS